MVTEGIQTTHEIVDRKYVSNKGTRFEIAPYGALFKITMKKGGKAPQFCNQLFTSFKRAEEVLEDYLKQTDRRGYAIYPSKERDAQS